MLLVKIEERTVSSDNFLRFCMNESMNRLQYQNEICILVSATTFFRHFMVAVDFIQSTKISPRHRTFSPLGRKERNAVVHVFRIVAKRGLAHQFEHERHIDAQILMHSTSACRAVITSPQGIPLCMSVLDIDVYKRQEWQY